MNRALTYSEKMMDPRWQRRRLEVFQRDGWRCRACNGESKQLHAHHLFYRKGAEPWDYEGDALVTLCDPCHENEHRHVEEHWRLLRMRIAAAGGIGAIGGIDYLEAMLVAVAVAKEMGPNEALDFFRATAANLRADADATALDAKRVPERRATSAWFSEESRRWVLEYEQSADEE